MRASFVFSEVITGLRRNVTMTVAMILTTAISLGLLGGGLLIVRTIDKMQNLFLSQLEVAVNLTDDISANDPNCLQDACQTLRAELQNTPGVKDVQFESRNQAYQRFKQEFSAMPELEALARPEALPASLRVTLNSPDSSAAIEQAFANKPHVKSVDDQGVFVARLTDALNGVRNATFVIALIQALAALMLISNTIQVSAFTRRTEVGIMRLVGATRWYTQLPFLLEAVVAGVIGAVLAVGGLMVAKVAFLDKALGSLFQSGIIPQISLLDVVAVSPWMLLTAVGVSALTGYLTLRMYVRL
ncbi:MAG TPA: permease-like cell division protein FtsX [Pseudonocardiaceae bacterium]|jgi:cell division transport system permease protein|nr:permease-like cell division protein FtsX [Pseudonocardiaceae bacterium]